MKNFMNSISHQLLILIISIEKRMGYIASKLLNSYRVLVGKT